MARVHPQSSGRALAASASGAKSGRNLFKRQLTQREFALEQEHRRLDLFEYLVSFNAEQAAKRDDTFARFDADGSGEIDASELPQLTAALGVTLGDAEAAENRGPATRFAQRLSPKKNVEV